MDINHIGFGERKDHCKSSPRTRLCQVHYLLPFLISTSNKRNLIFTIFLLQFREVTDFVTFLKVFAVGHQHSFVDQHIPVL